jgi:hypothetical protein
MATGFAGSFCLSELMPDIKNVEKTVGKPLFCLQLIFYKSGGAIYDNHRNNAWRVREICCYEAANRGAGKSRETKDEREKRTGTIMNNSFVLIA